MLSSPENNKPTKRTIEIWGRRSLPCTMRQTTRSGAYSFKKAIFAPAARRWALTRFPRSFANFTVLGKKDRRSLEVAAAVPWFWRKDRRSLPTFVSFVYVSMGGKSGKHSAELKAQRRGGQHLPRRNQRQIERFFPTNAELLEVAFTLRSFLRKKKQEEQFYASLCKMIREKSARQQALNQASPVLVFYTWHCIAGHESPVPSCLIQGLASRTPW